MCVSVYLCVYLNVSMQVLRNPERASDPLRLSYLQVVNCLTRVSGTKWVHCKSSVYSETLSHLSSHVSCYFYRVLSIQAGFQFWGTRNEYLVLLFPTPEYLDCICVPLCLVYIVLKIKHRALCMLHTQPLFLYLGFYSAVSLSMVSCMNTFKIADLPT